MHLLCCQHNSHARLLMTLLLPLTMQYHVVSGLILLHGICRNTDLITIVCTSEQKGQIKRMK